MFVSRVRLISGLFLLAGTLFWFGCPTPPKQPTKITVLDPAVSPAAPPAEPSVETVLVPSEPAIQAPSDRVGSVLPEERLNLRPGTLPLHDWDRLCGFEHLRVINPTFPRTVELRTIHEGVLLLTVGQRNVRWNGVNLGLGFAPAIVAGEIALNALDVAKNIYPLAIGSLPAFNQRRVLVLDPGHGGADPGSRGGPRAAVEKDLALDWALRVERLLTNSSWQVVLTRRDDRDVSLLERVAIADAAKASLFISLHFNSLEQSGSAREESGIETYCLTPAGMPSTVSRNYEDDTRKVFPNNQFDSENVILAMRMHSELVRSTGRRDRGVKRARFMTVLREQRRPAVLIEGGFLSNPAEANLILQPAFRQQMAQAVRAALPE